MLYNGKGHVNQMFYAQDFKNNNLVLRHSPPQIQQPQMHQHLLTSSFAPITTGAAINNVMSSPTVTRSKSVNVPVNAVHGHIHHNTASPCTNSILNRLPQQPLLPNQMMNEINAGTHSSKSALGGLQPSISINSPERRQHPKVNVPAVFPVSNNILSSNLSDFEDLISPETACNIDNGDWAKVPEAREWH